MNNDLKNKLAADYANNTELLSNITDELYRADVYNLRFMAFLAGYDQGAKARDRWWAERFLGVTIEEVRDGELLAIENPSAVSEMRIRAVMYGDKSVMVELEEAVKEILEGKV